MPFLCVKTRCVAVNYRLTSVQRQCSSWPGCSWVQPSIKGTGLQQTKQPGVNVSACFVWWFHLRLRCRLSFPVKLSEICIAHVNELTANDKCPITTAFKHLICTKRIQEIWLWIILFFLQGESEDLMLKRCSCILHDHKPHFIYSYLVHQGCWPEENEIMAMKHM